MENRCWNLHLLQQLFLPFEVEEIRSIPLSYSLPSDKQIWIGTSNGLFIVRSAYKLAMDNYSVSGGASSSNDSNLRYFWKKVWRLPVPHKVKHFLWRACRDILPTKANLMQRKVLSDDICEECMLEVETSAHFFWSCPRAKLVWRCSGLLNPDYAGPNFASFNSFMELVWKMLMVDRYYDSMVAMMGMIAWRLWGNRNKVHHGGKRLGELELCHDASIWLLQFQEANEATAATAFVQFEPMFQRTWLPLSNQMYKVTVDGAVFKDRNESGVGVIIRDVNGLVVAAMCKKFHALLGTLEVEAKAFESGLLFAKDARLQEFILEGDSLNVVCALQGVLPPSVLVMSIIYGIQSSCNDVRKVLFSHVCKK